MKSLFFSLQFLFFVPVFFSQNNNQQLLIQSGHSSTFYGAVSPDGRILVTGGFDGKILVWDLKSARHFKPMFEHANPITDVKWSNNGHYFYSGDYGGTLIKWDAESKLMSKKISNPDSPVLRLAATGNNNIAVCRGDSTLQLYNSDLDSLASHDFKTTYAIAITHCKIKNMDVLIVGCRDSVIRIFNADNLKLISTRRTGDIPLDFSFNSTYSQVGITGSENTSLCAFPEMKMLKQLPTPIYFYNPQGNYHILSTLFGRSCFYKDSLFISSTMENELVALNLKSLSEKYFYDLPSSAGFVSQFVPVPQSTQLISIHMLVQMYLWEMKESLKAPDNTVSKGEIKMNAQTVGGFNFSEDGKKILVSALTTFEYSLAEGTSTPRSVIGAANFHPASFTRHQNRICNIEGADYTRYNFYGSNLIHPDTALLFSADINADLVSQKKPWVWIAWNNYCLGKYSTTNFSRMWSDSSFKKKELSITALQESADGAYLAVFCREGPIHIINTSTGKTEKILSNQAGEPTSGFFSNDNKYFFVTVIATDQIVKWNISSGKIEKEITAIKEVELMKLIADKNEKAIVIAGFDNTIRMIDYNTGAEIKRIPPENSGYYDFKLSPDNNYLATLNTEGIIAIYSYPELKKCYSIVSIRNKMQAIPFSDDNFYIGGKFQSSVFSVLENDKILPIEQFDLQFNRPDKIIERTKYCDTSLVSAYRMSYEKRRKKYKYNAGLNSVRPELSIKNRDKIPFIILDRELKIAVTAKSAMNLKNLTVLVNKVPVYGILPVNLARKKQIDTTLIFRLQNGDNQVEVKVTDEAGNESAIALLKVRQITKEVEKDDLYIVGIGVSIYKQENYNLRYAAKDARDISNKLDRDTFLYKKTHRLVLIDNEVTKGSLQKIKDFLKGSKENDAIVIYMAGHGVLNKELDYFFAPYDMDFQNPEKNGITVDDLEKILAEVKPFQKLLIFDSCHSGELVKEDVVVSEVKKVEEGSITFRSSGSALGQSASNKKSSKLLNSMFTELSSPSGTTIVTAASGSEFAMESSAYKNGLFTYCFLNAMNSWQADLDGDRSITLEEMIVHLRQKVSELSGGEQEPNTRYENEFTGFRFR
jgi:WD40 repeat protein